MRIPNVGDPCRKLWTPEATKVKAAAGEGPGGFQGYGAVYGNIDRDEEIIAPGAFADSLRAFVRDGFIGEAHDWDRPVATIDDAVEDAYGLMIAATYHTDPASQSVRTYTNERLERGKSVGLSVGFRMLEWSYDEEADRLTITKGDLFEVSIVTVPANPLAGIMSGKGWKPSDLARSIKTIRDFEGFLRDAGYSKAASTAIASRGFAAWQGEPADGSAELAELELLFEQSRSATARTLARIETP